ncbi:helix-turn-helix domain-containing protein [Tsukamurella sp. 8F]|uniref:ArsR/SmtB family transcription factor n=1 Tax=unclassified Tsukamurella TaxID=2633480 RepID=UPI0023BA2A21|nr:MULTISPECIES: helix-turn-helix domain-containing protein [unclassified Tsukamurella]MDF0530622.1 helix-turn-helix domain-containing protein [Tsukamurella sp. 8J]MDF0587823.1 helix-turn-helix domain-containing protein [Tsukamurella sp. 8F]
MTTPAEADSVAPIQTVLAALADPVRLEMVRRLAAVGGEVPVACCDLYEGVTKATASHHFKILRTAGITRRETVAGAIHQVLRRDDVESAYPGLLDAVVGATRR